jgi:8-oxo-dGTP pyrophosphatase MutT (NUDIX family)
MFQVPSKAIAQRPPSKLFSVPLKPNDASADTDWKNIVVTRPPEAYLSTPPHKLPNFGKYHWRVYIAPIIIHRDTLNLGLDTPQVEDTEQDNAVRALYIVQKIEARSPGLLQRNDEWRFLSGDIKTGDADVKEAVFRIVEQKTGMHVRSVLGSYHPNIIRDKPNQQRNVCMFFIVNVKEEDMVASQHDIVNIPLTLFRRHDGHRWVTKNDRLNDRIYPVDYIKMILDWPWLDPMTLLRVPAKDVPKVTGQGYFLNAAIMRQTGSAKPAILMLQRRDDQGMPRDWELPGAKLPASDRNVEVVLREIVKEQTGLTVMRTTAHCSARTMGPVQMKAKVENSGASYSFVLGYCVTVKNVGLPTCQDGVTWQWFEEEELASLNSWTRLPAKRALQKEVVQRAALRKYDGRHRDVRAESVCHWDRERED